MKLKKLTLILLSVLFIPKTTFAFSDLDSNHPYYEAITYLKEKGVIEGYEDNTFRPDKPIQRDELLKILIEGLKLEKDDDISVPFSDFDPNIWNQTYIKTAYSRGWIEGYQDNTFRPFQSINKAESLKLAGESLNWTNQSYSSPIPFSDVESSQWYANYVGIASEQNLLPDSSDLFNPNQDSTRGYISEIIYRSIQNDPQLLTFFDNPDNSSSNSIDKEFYSNIILDNNIPTNFLQNEVYSLSGQILSGSKEIIIIKKNSETNQEQLMSVPVINNRFNTAIYFEEIGNFELAIIPNSFGTAKSATINIKPFNENSSNLPTGPSTSDFSLNFENETTQIKYSTPNSNLKKITFSQNQEKVEFLTKQYTTQTILPYNKFQNFEEGQVLVEISSAQIDPQTLDITSQFGEKKSTYFTAIQHLSSFRSDNYLDQNFPYQVNSNGEIQISGTLTEGFRDLAYIVTPSGKIESIEIDNSSNFFELSYFPEEKGAYLFEINDNGGIALINQAIYVGSGIPLIPEFFDLNTRTFASSNFSLTAKRNEMLALINNFRAEYNLPPVEIINELNNLAQIHTDDMAENNYFAHLNLAGESPEDRRLRLNIATPVGENLAKDTSVEFAHHGLIKSAIHRENILNPTWNQVGIGITEKGGYLYISQQFSYSIPNENDLQEKENQLFQEINQSRSENNTQTLNRTSNLNQASELFNQKIIEENKPFSQETFEEVINESNIQGNIEAFLRVDITTEYKESEYSQSFLDNLWTQIGIDIKIDDSGFLNTILFLNKP